MSSSKRLLVTSSFLVTAFVCYGLGHMAGFGLFFLLGAGFEIVFWFRVFTHHRQQRLSALRNSE